MAQGTLSLKKAEDQDQSDTKPADEPQFDESAHYGEVGGMHPARYIQGKYLFNNAKHFCGAAPKHMWLAPLTAEQEKKRREQMVLNKKFFNGANKPKMNEGAIPQTVINAERENAQVRAVEARAE